VIRLHAEVAPALVRQAWYPELQVRPQETPLQVAVPFVIPGQTLQAEPQVFTLLLLAQVEPQMWYPALHEIPHDVPSQVAFPFVGEAHAVHEVPHDDVLVLAAHDDPQAW
jgi:hypothetical protein